MIPTISVLAGGASLRGVDLSRLPGVVVAVNDAAIYSPRVDIVLSMDRMWTEGRWDLLCASPRPTYLRPACLPNITERPPWLSVYQCDYDGKTPICEPSLTPGRLQGSNSGMVALNLALQLRPARVVLFGFDHYLQPNGTAYWYPQPPWQNGAKRSGGKYKEWSAQYAPLAAAFIAAGVEVLNASTDSRISNFPKCSPEGLLA